VPASLITTRRSGCGPDYRKYKSPWPDHGLQVHRSRPV